MNSLIYFSKHSTKKQADLEKIKDMNRRFKAIGTLIKDDIFDYLNQAYIEKKPASFKTPILWLDTIEVPYEYLGQEINIKFLLCYTLHKAHRRRRFLWACPLFDYDSEDLREAFKVLRERAKKDPRFIILPADDSLLLEEVKNIFPESKIQADLASFKQTVADLLPNDYSEAFKKCFDSAFKHDNIPGYTEETLKLIEKSLSHHKLEEALNIFKNYNDYILTLFKIGINYCFNFKNVKNLKNKLILKRENNENNYSFFMRTLEAVRDYTWDIPCVYMDEINPLF